MEQPTTPFRRPPGRPRKNPEQPAAANDETPQASAAAVAAAPAGLPAEPSQAPKDPTIPEMMAELPLFAGTQFQEDRPESVHIIRVGPVYEGIVGKLRADATEDDIKRQFGGGEYRLELRTSRGLGVRNGTKQISLAGEPIFQSQARRMEYLRLVRNQMEAAPLTFEPPQHAPQPQASPAPVPAPAPPPPPQYIHHVAPPPAPAPAASEGFGALIAAILQAQSQQTSTMMTLIMESAKQREEATMRLFELTRQQTPADPLSLMREGINLARKLSGGGKDEGGGVIEKVIDMAPRAIGQVRDTIREERQLREKVASSAPTPAAMAAAMEQIRQARDKVMFEDELAAHALRAIENMQAHGVDPMAALAQFFQEIASFGATQFENAGLKQRPPTAVPAPAPPPVVAGEGLHRSPAPAPVEASPPEEPHAA